MVTQADPLGRVLSVSRAGVALEQDRYDENGNLLSKKDAEGRETVFTYDNANRPATRVEGFGSPEAGVTELRHDENGNLTEERDGRARDLGLPFSTKNTYDELDRLETVTDGAAHTTVYGYDEEGNRNLMREPEGQSTTFAYDELGKLRRVTQPGNRATSYDYDPARNRIRQTDANHHGVEMTYDELGRVLTMTQDPGGLGLVTSHAYDANGNERLLTDAKGQAVTSTYDELNRLKTKTYAFALGDEYRPWRHTTGIVYTYDANNSITEVQESVASGTDPPVVLTTTRVFDDFDRLLSETSPLPDGGTRTVANTYFANGTRKTVTDPTGAVTAYTYDGRNRLATATTAVGTPQAALTTYSYFPDDLLKSVTYPSGVAATHGYDSADRLVSVANRQGATSISSYDYMYDGNGNRLTQVESNGGTTETTTYAYDDLNRLEAVTYPADATFLAGRKVTYGYDDVGNRTSEVTTNPATGAVLASKTGTFDNVNRLSVLTDDVAPAQTASFAWDRNGNQTGKTVGGTTTIYRYDVRDRMVETVQGENVLGRFQYDFEGRRTKKIGSDGIVQYVYDQTSVLAEYDARGVQNARYDYGSDRLISLLRTDEGRRWYSLDGLRSVVNLTDDAGSLVASYHLDPWGNFRFPAELSTSRNRFGFTGYEWDPELGLFNAKARYFDPQIGRFTSQDSFLGSIDHPPSVHRYFYANANPTRFIDPTGHFSLEDLKRTASDTGRFIADVGRTGYGFSRNVVQTTGEAIAGTGVLLARITQNLQKPRHRIAGLEPIGQQDFDAVKAGITELAEGVALTGRTLAQNPGSLVEAVQELGPQALDAAAELGPTASGAAIGKPTIEVVGTVAAVQALPAMARGATGTIRAAPAAADEVAANLTRMLIPGDAPVALVVLEQGSAGPIGTTASAPRVAGPITDPRRVLSVVSADDLIAAKYQQYYNEAAAVAVRDFNLGEVRIPAGTNWRQALGQRVDDAARRQLRGLLRREGIPEGPLEAVKINRWLRDPSGSGRHRIPDVMLDESRRILDGTIGDKALTDPQSVDFRAFSGGYDVTLVRPQTGPLSKRPK
jgi:RHS repeat-associated protein